MFAVERPYRILIGDDQPAVLDALKMLFRSEGFEVETARSPNVILESLSMREYEMLLLDLNYARDTTSGREGLDLIKKIKEADNHVPIIVMTAWATIDIWIPPLRTAMIAISARRGFEKSVFQRGAGRLDFRTSMLPGQYHQRGPSQ